jgi:hypothetical protein
LIAIGDDRRIAGMTALGNVSRFERRGKLRPSDRVKKREFGVRYGESPPEILLAHRRKTAFQ